MGESKERGEKGKDGAKREGLGALRLRKDGHPSISDSFITIFACLLRCIPTNNAQKNCFDSIKQQFSLCVDKLLLPVRLENQQHTFTHRGKMYRSIPNVTR
jgi:hypothetical protein